MWSRPSFPGDIVYSVGRRIQGLVTTVDSGITDSGSTVTYTLTGLEPFVTYTVIVTAMGTNIQDPNICQIAAKTSEGSTE